MSVKIQIIGNVGRDPSVRYTQGGKCVASLSLASTYKKEGRPDVTSWFKVTVWDELAERVGENVKKGDFILVEGYRVEIDTWEDKSGSTRADIAVTANKVMSFDEWKAQQGETEPDDVPNEDAPF